MVAPTGTDLLIYCLGYFAAIVGPMPALYFIGDHLWRIALHDAHITEKEGAKEHNTLIPAVVGILERFLYVACLFLGRPEFIGIWFTLRVAGAWTRWAEGFTSEENPKHKVPGRTVFNIFCIGFATSLIVAFACFVAINWALAGHIAHALWSAAGVLLAAHGLAGVIAYKYKHLAPQVA